MLSDGLRTYVKLSMIMGSTSRMTTERKAAACDHWLSQYLFDHPLLSSAVEVLPGLSLCQMVAAVAREAWSQAVESERDAFGAIVAGEQSHPDASPPRLNALEAGSPQPPLEIVRQIAAKVPTSPGRAAETKEERRKRMGKGIREYWARMGPEERAAQVEKRFGNKRGRQGSVDNGPRSIPEAAGPALKEFWGDFSPEQQQRIREKLVNGEAANE